MADRMVHLDLRFRSGSSSSSLFGSRSMVSFEDGHGKDRGRWDFFQAFDSEENAADDDFEEYLHQPEKKRRLTGDQVKFLERTFEVYNKLETDRKVQLAKDLGLQQRQVAIWFQNRRARWKTKQLERDHDALRSSFNSLKSDYEDLLKEKDKLKDQVSKLTEMLVQKEKGRDPIPQQCEEAAERPRLAGSEDSSAVACNQEDIRRAIFNSDSLHCVDGVHSSLLEAADSSYAFEAELSQDEEDNLSKTLLKMTYVFQKVGDGDYADPPVNLCNFGLQAEDQPFWSWAH